MMRRPIKLPPVAVALKSAVLLVVASGLSGIAINDIIPHRSEVARGQAPSKVQLMAPRYHTGAKPR